MNQLDKHWLFGIITNRKWLTKQDPELKSRQELLKLQFF